MNYQEETADRYKGDYEYLLPRAKRRHVKNLADISQPTVSLAYDPNTKQAMELSDTLKGVARANMYVYEDESEMLYYYDNHKQTHFPQVIKEVPLVSPKMDATINSLKEFLEQNNVAILPSDEREIILQVQHENNTFEEVSFKDDIDLDHIKWRWYEDSLLDEYREILVEKEEEEEQFKL